MPRPPMSPSHCGHQQDGQPTCRQGQAGADRVRPGARGVGRRCDLCACIRQDQQERRHSAGDDQPGMRLQGAQGQPQPHGNRYCDRGPSGQGPWPLLPPMCVQNSTLHTGDVIIAGAALGPCPRATVATRMAASRPSRVEAPQFWPRFPQFAIPSMLLRTSAWPGAGRAAQARGQGGAVRLPQGNSG